MDYNYDIIPSRENVRQLHFFKAFCELPNTAEDKFTLDGFTFIDLFSGIGGIRLPFDELRAKCVFFMPVISEKVHHS
jgi:C-5 cytosine-specific DNA methylase